MFTANKYGLLYFLIILLSLKKCASELLPPPTPSLVLFSPGDAEYAPVLVRRQGDNVTLRCELRGGGVVSPRRVLWNYLPEGEDYVHLPLQPTGGAAHGSELAKSALRLNDSGAYVCSAPPHSVTKYLLVQPREGPVCARGALVCGTRCVLPTYLCDGRADCTHGEDEAPRLCGTLAPCQAPDRLNCSTGRCIPLAACCRPSTAPALCRQPHCCLEQRAYEMDGFVDVEYPALFEDRHAPDDYSFIQSTIYTVTACALIFMIAVVLLVSAICKMHMKRAQLRSYRPGCSHRALRINSLGGLQLQARFPPCYEASRLLEQRRERTSPQGSQPTSPDHSQPASPMRVQTVPEYVPPEEQSTLGRLGTLFSGRYRQVPTQCSEVELQDVHCGSEPTSLHGSPAVGRPRPTCPTAGPTLGSAEFYFSSAAAAECGRQLNCSSDMYRRSPTLLDLYRRDSLPRPAARPLTLQLGRFQLSIPTFGRRPALATPRDATRRPDTPNIAEINIDDLDFVRLNSNETYTLNGRTIRLLGGEFENYPSEDYPSTEMTLPPPYNEAVRYKLYGPPPHYLSRDALESNGNGNGVTVTAEDQATDNVEMPPRYEDLTVSNGGENGLVDVTGNCDDLTVSNGGNTVVENGLVNLTGAVSSNDGGEVTVGGIYNVIGSESDATSGNGICNATETSYDAINNVTMGNNNFMPTDNGNRSVVVTTTNSSNVTNEDVATNGNTVANTGFRASEVAGFAENNGNMTLSAIIDNLPAIDSDVNANDTVILGTCNGETVIENGINVMVDNGN